MRLSAAVLCALLLLSAPTRADQTGDCEIAYARGDYAGYHINICQSLQDQIAAKMQKENNPLNVSHIYAGCPSPKDYTNAIQLLQPLAKSGDVDAQVKLSEVIFMACHRPYIPPTKPPCDYQALIKWSRTAAEKDNAEANFVLGMAYDWAIKPDQTTQAESVKWLSKAAELGYERAKEQLGAIYSDKAGNEGKAGMPDKARTDWADAYFWASVTKIGHNNSQYLQEFRVHLTADSAGEQDRRAEKWLKIHPIHIIIAPSRSQEWAP